MKRDWKKLAEDLFDVLVVGGGIQGAFAAWDAALRGFRTALIDKGDFGGSTSHNSFKIIHGGLRYVQHADVERIRESVRERRWWLRAAPQWVRPLRFVMPTYGHGIKGREALWLALRAYGALGWDRNEGLDPTRRIPSGGLLSVAEAKRAMPGVPSRGLSGGAFWYDGQVMESDYVLLSVVREAVSAGTVATNYVEALEFFMEGGRVAGVLAKDQMSGETFSVRARVTVLCAGPWVPVLARKLSRGLGGGMYRVYARGLNLVVRRDPQDHAFGVVSGRDSDAIFSRRGRLYFITPWKSYSIIGTSHLPYDESPDAYVFTEDEIDGFLKEINEAWPAGRLKREDVVYVYGGLTPARSSRLRDQVRRGRKVEIRDFACEGFEGVIGVTAVKYTTARLVAEDAVDAAARKLGRTECSRTVERILPPTNDGEALSERCVRAVREDMAVRLDDVVFRRTGFQEWMGDFEQKLESCARTMAAELGWSKERTRDEIQRVTCEFRRHQPVHSGHGQEVAVS